MSASSKAYWSKRVRDVLSGVPVTGGERFDMDEVDAHVATTLQDASDRMLARMAREAPAGDPYAEAAR